MIPVATYRLQLRPEFGFAEAAAIAPYLVELGISHVYCSPYLQAGPGSTHGYDVVDHQRVNEELGGEAGLIALQAELERLGLGQVLDIVPNHMSAAAENVWWQDVQANGQASAYSSFFDIDWDEAGQTMRGYRRFFEVDGLPAIRVEAPEVFEATHRRVLEWVAAGKLHGLRVDHPDGLYDPTGYLERLAREAPGAWIVVEKILQPGERLRESWPIGGTTGYEALRRIGGLFVDGKAEHQLTRIYADFTGETVDWRALVYAKKMDVLKGGLAADLERLARCAVTALEFAPELGSWEEAELLEALREVAASFPVYRSYVRAKPRSVTGADEDLVKRAVSIARGERPDLPTELFGAVERLLLLKVNGDPAAEVAQRFQQITPAVMAKGVEDAAFYCFNRLMSLNEVGGDPGVFGTSPAEFQQANQETQERWPRAMVTTATHDHKRGEDTRIRINLLSEIGDEWEQTVRTWSGRAERYRSGSFPDRNAEYLFYQTLVGAWPIDAQRGLGYMRKATREAKQHTGWVSPNEEYERALDGFVRGCLGDEDFRTGVADFVNRLRPFAHVSSLAQTLLKLTGPGLPDVYQGCELWDLSLVDPDNRRPIDFELRRRLLREARGLAPEEIMGRAEEGLPKLWLIQRALAVRREYAEAFGAEGKYEPLEACGPKQEHVVAFSRGGRVVVVVPRLVIGLDGDWRDTGLALPEGAWMDALSREPAEGDVPIERLLARFPVALLTRSS